MQLKIIILYPLNPKIGGLDGKTEQNRLKVPNLLPFFQKISAFIEK